MGEEHGDKVEDNTTTAQTDDPPPSDLQPILTQKRAWAKSKQQSAMNCFNTFLEEYWTTNIPKPQNVSGDRRLLHTLITEEDLDPGLSGSFCNYLAHAKLSWATSQAYLGQVKSYLLEANMHSPNAREKVEDCFGKSESFQNSRRQMKQVISYTYKEPENTLISFAVPMGGGTISD